MVKKIDWQRDKVEVVSKIKSNFDFLSIDSLKRKFESLPPIIKWVIAVIAGGFLYKLTELLLNTYIKQFKTIEEISAALQIQILFDIVLIAIIIILIATLLKEGDL